MRSAVLVFVLLTSSSTFGSQLFNDDSILEVTLSGPLSTLFRKKQSREELSFTLTTGDATVDVAVRVRGKSRVVVCRFPPLRLNFPASGASESVFAGEDKLKLVTHCRNGRDQSQDSVLNEYTAYRLFNLISDLSYRVRLLKIHYKDTDGKQKRLDEPHYGFLIESDDNLAKRLGGTVETIEAMRFSTLDMQQTARLNAFQYLIGNKDWSFVTADSDDTCCHNIDLLDVDGLLVPVPYDFDLAALINAKYRSGGQLNQARRREYIGYCATPEDAVNDAVDHLQALMEEILATAMAVPALDTDSQTRRVEFLNDYFEESADKASLLNKFRRNCTG